MYFLFIASEKRVLEACPGPGGVSAGTRVRVTGDEHRALPPGRMSRLTPTLSRLADRSGAAALHLHVIRH